MLLKLQLVHSHKQTSHGYDSDAGVDHNVATNLKGPQEIDEIDIPQVGDDGTASNGVDKEQSSDNFVNIPPAELSKTQSL